MQMYKQDLALNNLQELICQRIQPNQTKPNHHLLVIGYAFTQLFHNGGRM